MGECGWAVDDEGDRRDECLREDDLLDDLLDELGEEDILCFLRLT